MSQRPELEQVIAECLDNLGKEADTLLEPRATLKRAVSAEQAANTAALLDAFVSDELLIEGTLGEGGMGVVHFATQASLGRKVAVKQLSAAHRTPENQLKLLREAWIAGSLEHPNILPVYDIRFDETRNPQIVLKRIDGVCWADVIDDAWAVKERFGVDNLLEHNLEVLMQVCRAVHFAHSRGVVHRDLKPDNVMIGANGEVYLCDWGIAVALKEVDRFPTVVDDRAVAGTPGYMAPELLMGERPTPRTDVYLLGAMLYEVLAGRPPHVGDTPEDVVRSVLESKPPPPEGAPRELYQIALEAMTAEQERRFESAHALRMALADYLQHRSSSRMVGEAERRLEALLAVVDSRDEPAHTRRAEAYELYGGCRFGFREALAAWPDSMVAQRGIEHAVEAMVELELEGNDPEAAAELLAELPDPPERLTRRVEQARRAIAVEREQMAALVELGKDRDAARGMASRRVLVAVLGLAWTIAPAATAWLVDPATGRYPSMLVAPVVVLGLLGVLFVWRKREMTATAINRGVVATIVVGLIGQLGVAALGPAMGIDEVQARIFMLLLWAIVVAVGGAMIDKGLWWGALGFFGAFVYSALASKTVAHVLYVMAVAYLIITINALIIWDPARQARAEKTEP